MDDLLTDLLHPRFALEVDGRTADRDAILAEMRRAAAALGEDRSEGRVIEVPAADPVALLGWLGGAWRTGQLPLPSTQVAVPSPAPLPRSDAALILRSSGSTGPAKYAEFTSAAIRASTERIARYVGLGPDDRVGLVQPLAHGFGLVGQLLAAAVSGARAIWAASPFPAERSAQLRRGRVTVLAAVPYVLARLVDEELDGDALRFIGSAGARLSTSLATRLVDAFPRAVVWNQYGCTEAGPRLTACPSGTSAFAAGSVGRPIEGVSIRIDRDDQIAFRTDTAMRGYLGDEAATAAARSGDFWLTGDVGRIDADGNLHVLGRVDDVVKVRGLKVSLQVVARAVEAAGATVAVAVPLESGDDITVAALYEGPSVVSLKALGQHLGLESLPGVLRHVPQLPRLTNGKIDRGAVANLAKERA